MDGVATCRVCGCTDDDCRGCIERTGSPCYWVEPDLCSACLTTNDSASREGAAPALPATDTPAGASPYSPPFTTDVPQCCGEPATCNDPCHG